MRVRSTSALNPSLMGFEQAQIRADYRLMYKSRQVSLIGRREVLTGKAKFGIFGDGKELPQLAMARYFQPGDVRAGYYRDQTFALATGLADFHQLFSQLYANTDIEAEPHSGGRQMNSHFASRNLDKDGNWQDLTRIINSSPDASPTASQMPRLVGLAQASKLYRLLPELKNHKQFSRHGNEVAFGTIGNASCAEGHFWETLNAIGIMQVPLVMSIWDDGYGISVPNEYQLTKSNLSDMLAGFQRTETERGFELFTVSAWDYAALDATYKEATKLARESHIPSLIHVVDVTQPQGHSTSGSHERYKSKERLEWEKRHDCLTVLREAILEQGIATEEELDAWDKEDRKWVRKVKAESWQAFQAPVRKELQTLAALLQQIHAALPTLRAALLPVQERLNKSLEVSRRELLDAAHEVLVASFGHKHPTLEQLRDWRRAYQQAGNKVYDSHLYSEHASSPLRVDAVLPEYDEEASSKPGYEILNIAFDAAFARHPELVAFGEDVGYLGDVNQGMAGLQEKYGPLRIFDTGIRENTIMGQALGLALRGLRPMAEIQYLDYILYGLQTLSDDVATVRYRTHNGQKAPAIIRTRGHRLEGIWHAGSPLGMLINSLRGMHIVVPRDMTRAVGFYQTLMAGDDPALVIEVLNGYRLKERLPNNLTDIRLPLGVPEILRTGKDLTVVTYGVCCRLAIAAARQLAQVGIDIEIIDVQTLLPFDRPGLILGSLQKTNRILFLDEDVPGGATAYMLQQVIEKQNGYHYLDSEPRTLTAKAHRTAFGDDGDYFSKPQTADIFRTVYEMMHEAEPDRFPIFF
ncbi:MAG: thiamine pyrophosphate-dependent enzyme [Bacteroidota bacterium]